MWSQFTNVTDRRTDRQTTCDRNTALWTKVHLAVKTLDSYQHKVWKCNAIQKQPMAVRTSQQVQGYQSLISESNRVIANHSSLYNQESLVSLVHSLCLSAGSEFSPVNCRLSTGLNFTLCSCCVDFTELPSRSGGVGGFFGNDLSFPLECFTNFLPFLNFLFAGLLLLVSIESVQQFCFRMKSTLSTTHDIYIARYFLPRRIFIGCYKI